MLEEKLQDSCGVFGVFNSEKAAEEAYLGLYSIQHRGQSGTGIAVSDGEEIMSITGIGKVNDVFEKGARTEKLKGRNAIGHNLHSRKENLTQNECQPRIADCRLGQIAGSMNGALTNGKEIRAQLEEKGLIFSSGEDIETIIHLIARSKRQEEHASILDALSTAEGAYSILFLTKDALYAARDHKGKRPLVLGKKAESYFLSSETCALDIVGAEAVREIMPGEMIRIENTGIHEFTIPKFDKEERVSKCSYEHIYISRPDSKVFGCSVNQIRRELGRELARQHPAIGADIVIDMPDSGKYAALGYSEESGIKYDAGLIRNHYVDRMISMEDSQKDLHARIKFNVIDEVIKGKSVVVVDDSILNATTIKRVISMIRRVDPSAIHLRISSPKITKNCIYGVDMPPEDTLIANRMESTEKIREYLKVDSLGYLSTNNLQEKLGKEYCMKCFGNTPV